MSLPLKSISFGIEKHAPPIGWIGLADAALVTSRAPGSIPRAVTMALLQPRADVAGVLIAGGGEPVAELGVEVTNRLRVPCRVNVSVEMRIASGPMGIAAPWAACGAPPPAVLAPWQSLQLTCGVAPAASPAGFIAVRGMIASSDCWTANDSATVVEAAVVLALPQPPVAPVARNERAAVFGGQMVPSYAAITRLGMRSVRSGPMWRWAQTAYCWTPDCFGGFAQFYDRDVYGASAAGVEVMLDARAVPAALWSVATNASGPTWQSFPGPAHYEEFTRYLTIMLQRYGSFATAVEVDNEDDGIHYFMPQPPPMDYVQNLSLALIDCTAAALTACGANCSGIELMGLSASLFDVMQDGNGGSTYMAYEKAILATPGVLGSLAAVTAHPYTLGQVPFIEESWGNVSFLFPNETATGRNSTSAGLLALAALMSAEAAAQGMPDYKPRLRPSEAGYDLELGATVSGGWAMMHAALISQLLLHMRSAPLATHVEKFFLFAAYDGCCVESGGYFGLFRPGLERTGPNASEEFTMPSAWTEDTVPLPSAAAYALVSVLVDVPSGRLPGRFVVDNSASGAATGAPSCIAFETDASSPLHAPPLAVFMTTAHHYNDRTPATARVTTASPAALLLRNGLGTPLEGAIMPAPGGASLALSIAPLPQFLILPSDTTAAAVCTTLEW